MEHLNNAPPKIMHVENILIICLTFSEVSSLAYIFRWAKVYFNLNINMRRYENTCVCSIINRLYLVCFYVSGAIVS